MLAFWASFGPRAGLYRVLYYLPTFSFLRAPSRLGLVVSLVWRCSRRGAAARCFERRRAARRRRRVGAIAVAAAIGDVARLPIRWDRAPAIPSPATRVLARSPRAPLAEFPFYGERIAFPLHAQYMLFSTTHWMPLVNGYSDVIPLDFREAAPVLDSFPSPDAFAVLARHRVRYIAVHWDMYVDRAGRRSAAGCERVPRESAGCSLADERMTLLRSGAVSVNGAIGRYRAARRLLRAALLLGGVLLLRGRLLLVARRLLRRRRASSDAADA